MPTASRTRAIDARTRDILAAAQCDGNELRLGEQLSPSQYAPVKKVLTALGGLWAPAVKAIVFPHGTDAVSLLAGVLASGIAPLAPRTAEGFVRTPDNLADDLCGYPNTDLAWLPAGATVLEPSAGDGSLVAAILRANPNVAVTAVEPNPSRAAVTTTLNAAAVDVHAMTLETFAATAISAGQRFDAVVMNPPFAVPGDPVLWMEHVRLAWNLLRPGATLVSVVPQGFAFRTDAAHTDMRTFAEHYGTHQRLPASAFAASGIQFPTRLLRLVKPLDASGLDHVFTTRPEAPVRVSEPQLTAEAITRAPVQIWWDVWRRCDRLLRFRARCIQCGWLLWGFDDGQNDPRGVLGDFTSGFSLDAADYGMIGPTVGLCCGCGNDGTLYRAGLDKATKMWAPASDRAPALGSG